MTIYNLIEIMESYGSIRIVKRYTEESVFEGNTFEVPENLLSYPLSMIRARDSTLICYI